jgi:hypothetical protein
MAQAGAPCAALNTLVGFSQQELPRVATQTHLLDRPPQHVMDDS